MTDPKSRVQLALDWATALPAELPPDIRELAKELIGYGVPALCIVSARLLLRAVDERETQPHPGARIVGGCPRIEPETFVAPASSPGDDNEVAEWLDSNDGRLHTDTPEATHEGATAAEWASRYADAEMRAKNWEPLYNQALLDCGGIDTELTRHKERLEELEQRLARVAELAHDRDDDSHEWRSRRLGQCASLAWCPKEEALSTDPLKQKSTLKWAKLAHQLTESEDRYADLVNAAYPVLAWLPRNDPGARMVAERLTGVLAGQGERLDWKQAADAFVKQRDDALGAVRDAQVELTRLKEENAVLEARRKHVEAEWLSKLADEKAAHEVTRSKMRQIHDAANCTPTQMEEALTEIGRLSSGFHAWIQDRTESEPGRPYWHRDCQVNDCEREACWHYCEEHVPGQSESPKVCGTVSRSGRMSCTEPPGHDGPCADKGDAFAVGTPPESPVPVEALLEIRVGSKWRSVVHGHERTVLRYSPGGTVTWRDGGGFSDTWDSALFLTKHTWLSDPEPPAERPVGEGKP